MVSSEVHPWNAQFVHPVVIKVTEAGMWIDFKLLFWLNTNLSIIASEFPSVTLSS